MTIKQPPNATYPERSASAPLPGDEIPTHYKWCYGCGDDHPAGLHMKLIAGPGLSTRGTFVVTDLHQGAPGLAHGGLLSSALDEVLGSLNWLLGVPAVTGKLECDFRKPVPVGTTLYLNAEIEAVEGRKVFTKASAHMDALDGPVAVQATALFIQVDVEHFVQHGNAREVQAAIEDRKNKWGELARGAGVAGSAFEVNP